MTNHPDIEPILDSWLGEGTDILPDRSVEAVLRTVEHTSQRSAWRVPWRVPDMYGSSRLAASAGAAIVVVLVAGGLVFLAGSGGPPIGSETSASPTSSLVPASPTTAGVTPLGLAIVALDGSVRQELGLPPDAWSADLSADGAEIAFTTSSADLGTCGACRQPRRSAIVSVDGTASAYLYPSDESGGLDPASLGQFAWSPAGTELAFQADDGQGNLDIWVAAIDPSAPLDLAGGARRLTTDPAIDEFPAWSPDGSTIFYSNMGDAPADDSGFSNTQEIWSVPAEGGAPTRLTNDDNADTMPDVAADGTVAYWSADDIMAMDPNGTNMRSLGAGGEDLGFNPRWSPDGSMIALLRYDPSERAHIDKVFGLETDLPLLDVVVLDIATGELTEVGPRVASDVNPVSWTPDGQALLINRYDDGP